MHLDLEHELGGDCGNLRILHLDRLFMSDLLLHQARLTHNSCREGSNRSLILQVLLLLGDFLLAQHLSAESVREKLSFGAGQL